MDEQKKHKRAILLFVLIIPFLTELLSGNTPVNLIFNPIILMFFVIAYSFPALLLRELYLRWNLSLIGLFVLGLAYGLFNEGVAARTILQTGAVVATSPFEHYGTLGFNIPWVLLIVPWHAFFAIIYPIVLVHTIYPLEAKKSWLNKRMCIVLASVPALLGSMAYFSIDKFPNTSPAYLVICWVVLLSLVFFSRNFRSTPSLLFGVARDSRRMRYAALGLLIALIQFLPFIWSAARVTAFVQVLLVSIPYYFLLRHLRKQSDISGRTLSFIAIGHYALWTLLMTIIMLLQGNPVLLLGPVIVWGLLFFLAKAVARQPLIQAIGHSN